MLFSRSPVLIRGVPEPRKGQPVIYLRRRGDDGTWRVPGLALGRSALITPRGLSVPSGGGGRRGRVRGHAGRAQVSPKAQPPKRQPQRPRERVGGWVSLSVDGFSH